MALSSLVEGPGYVMGAWAEGMQVVHRKGDGQVNRPVSSLNGMTEQACDSHTEYTFVI